jgi:glutamyl-tRNA reductase
MNYMSLCGLIIFHIYVFLNKSMQVKAGVSTGKGGAGCPFLKAHSYLLSSNSLFVNRHPGGSSSKAHSSIRNIMELKRGQNIVEYMRAMNIASQQMQLFAVADASSAMNGGASSGPALGGAKKILSMSMSASTATTTAGTGTATATSASSSAATTAALEDEIHRRIRFGQHPEHSDNGGGISSSSSSGSSAQHAQYQQIVRGFNIGGSGTAAFGEGVKSTSSHTAEAVATPAVGAAAIASSAASASSSASNSNNRNSGSGSGSGKKEAETLEVIVMGLSHHNAKVDVREKLAIPEHEWNAVAAELCQLPSISEASVLSTCNRFELYLSGKNQYECMRDALAYLHRRTEGRLGLEELRRSLFMLSGEDAVWHLLRVSAGLDSLVVGEGQILAQVKRAHEHGAEESTGRGGKVISRLLHTAVAAGKRVRSETGISKGAVSVSSAAAEFTGTKLLGDCGVEGIENARITVVGAGKMARLLLVHLQAQGVTSVTVVNPTLQRMVDLQQELPDLRIEMKLMPDLYDVVAQSDVVYTCTASTSTIIDPEPLQRALLQRRPREEGPGSGPGSGPGDNVMFVDISVPRNVHDDCAAVPGARSYNVDDLKAVVQRNTSRRRREMLDAELILKEELGRFRQWHLSLGAIPTIARLQEKAESLRQEELSKAAYKLSALSQKDLETVEKVTKGIVAKLLHGPMHHLRQQQGGEADTTRTAILQLQKAFQLLEDHA